MKTASLIEVRDTALWVDDSGERDLPPVLCLPSLWLDRTMFDQFVDACSGRFRMVRPDWRGQGRSAPATSEVVSMDTCADDIEALIEVMELAPVNLVVQSMGGDVTLRLAARRQGLIRSMIMLGSSAREETAEQLTWVNDWLDGAHARGGFFGEDLDLLMQVMFGATSRGDPAMRVMLAHWRAYMEALPLGLWPAIRGVIERSSAVALLPNIQTPTLIFSGEEDMPRPPAWADELAAGLPCATLVRLKAVGHSPILEAPEVVFPQIIEFLQKSLVA